MPIGRTPLGDSLRCATRNRQRVNPRLAVALRLVANDERGAVRRNAVVVVATRGQACVNPLRLSTRDRDAKKAALAVEDKRQAVTRPIWRFDQVGCGPDDAAIFR